MKSVYLIASLMLVTSYAQAEPFASADAKAGKALVEKNCISCHAASFGGDGEV